jgi:hypothetical protein
VLRNGSASTDEIEVYVKTFWGTLRKRDGTGASLARALPSRACSPK